MPCAYLYRFEMMPPPPAQMDYNKISGFFPMEWILSGDFGWGFNKKKQRLAEEEAAKANKNK